MGDMFKLSKTNLADEFFSIEDEIVVHADKTFTELISSIPILRISNGRLANDLTRKCFSNKSFIP
jgi:hypothetical protein